MSAEGGEQRAAATGGQFWDPNEESYYGQNGDRSSASLRTNGSGGGRWHYPANFEDAAAEPARKKSKKRKEKKDRWARTEDAYSIGESGTTSRKKSKKRRSTVDDSSVHSGRPDSTTEFPEDAEGGLYGDYRRAAPTDQANGRGDEDNIFQHEF